MPLPRTPRTFIPRPPSRFDGATAYCGTFIHSVSPSEIEILLNTLLIVGANGEIMLIEPDFVDENRARDLRSNILHFIDEPNASIQLLTMGWHEFMTPSFVDTHVHASRFSINGLGHGLAIANWLETIAFPQEARFSDEQVALAMYGQCVGTAIPRGITTACYSTSLHVPAAKRLAMVCLMSGQRAFIGKVCMVDPNPNPERYSETTAEAVAGTREVIEYCTAMDATGELVRPIITPRSAISCTSQSLRQLRSLSNEYATAYGGEGILNQTHFCGSQDEANTTLQQYPGFSNEAELYRDHGLFNHKSVLAHCTLLSDDDLRAIKEQNCGVAHCPVSDTTIGGFGAAPIRRILSAGITKIGLGSDISCNMMDTMRRALVVSNATEVLSGGEEKRLTLEEVFYMATLGGAKVLDMGDKIGSFKIGKKFDALLVDLKGWFTSYDIVHASQALLCGEGELLFRRMWEQWITTGDNLYLKVVFVGGRRIMSNGILFMNNSIR